MKTVMYALLCAVAGARLGTKTAITNEYVALAPCGGGGTNTTIEWVKLSYPTGVSSADDVTITKVSTAAVPELGAWQTADPGGLALTAKLLDDNMYALVDKSGETWGGGCCADTLRVYPKTASASSTASFKEFALDPLVQSAMNTTQAHVSHTFDMVKLDDGTIAALFVVKYQETTINAPADAIVAMSTKDGSLIHTASGKASFNVFKEAGTVSTTPKDSRFKIQFYDEPSGWTQEQWHGNGIQRFTNLQGTSLLAFTHRMDCEAVIFKDPYTYNTAKGGGRILQRFGTPYKWTTSTDTTARYFGLNATASAFVSGVHNVYYRARSETAALGGQESVSLFVNSQDGKAAAYEFALTLRDEDDTSLPVDDTVFATDYAFAKLTYTSAAQGGARAIGDGVFVTMSGVDPTTHTGLEVADVGGKSKSHAYSLGGSPPLYDPFIAVKAATTYSYSGDDVAAVA